MLSVGKGRNGFRQDVAQSRLCEESGVCACGGISVPSHVECSAFQSVIKSNLRVIISAFIGHKLGFHTGRSPTNSVVKASFPNRRAKFDFWRISKLLFKISAVEMLQRKPSHTVTTASTRRSAPQRPIWLLSGVPYAIMEGIKGYMARNHPPFAGVDQAGIRKVDDYTFTMSGGHRQRRQ